MKARTQAQKRAAKRGRPLLPPTDREPNGRRSRRVTSTGNRDQDNMNVAVARRISHFGLVDRRRKDGSIETAAKQAIDQRLGYELGRLFLFGRLTWAQHEAGEYFASDMARFYATSGVQFPSARTAYLATKSESDPADKQAIRSITLEDKEAIAKQAHIRAGKLRKILLEVGDINTGRKVWRVAMALLVEDRPLAPHEEVFARRGLNALVRYYGVGEAAQ